MFRFLTENLWWINKTKNSIIKQDRIEITTEEDTDLWQRTYYKFRRTSAHMLVMDTEETLFSFSAKTQRFGKNTYDQCGLVIYQDEDNWFKCGLEAENEQFQNLGCAVTNNGYSDFSTTLVDREITDMYFRLNRRQGDFLLESSVDGAAYKPLRVFHLAKGEGKINFGVFAASPTKSANCKAVFTEMNVTECLWKAWQ
jgi:regulation of enolase protein 1 (concanavalin A-like superfamily)